MAEQWIEINRGIGRTVLMWDHEPTRVEGNRYFGPFTSEELHAIAEEVLDDEFETPRGFLEEISDVIRRWNNED